MCLLYVRKSLDLIPVAIQLQPDAGQDMVFTPRDKPEDWLMAKLWLLAADFLYYQCIEHILKTHLLVEPFAVALIRQLATSHPVYKLLYPHLRCL